MLGLSYLHPFTDQTEICHTRLYLWRGLLCQISSRWLYHVAVAGQETNLIEFGIFGVHRRFINQWKIWRGEVNRWRALLHQILPGSVYHVTRAGPVTSNLTDFRMFCCSHTDPYTDRSKIWHATEPKVCFFTSNFTVIGARCRPCGTKAPKFYGTFKLSIL